MSIMPHRRYLSLLLAPALVLTSCGRGPLYERGVEALRAGEDVAARAYFEKAISRQPGSSINAQAYNLVGVACWRLGELEHARQAFENSRNLDPTLAVAAYNLGVLAATTTNHAQAAALFHEAALLDPSDPRPLEYIAHLDSGRGRWEEATKTLEQALARAPLSARILTALALAELHTSDAQTAVARLGTALDADPDYAPAYLNLAILASGRLRDDAEAVVWLDKYLALDLADEATAGAAAWRRLLASRLPDDPADVADAQVPSEPLPLTPPPATPGADAEREAQAERRREAVVAYNAGTVAYARRDWDRAISSYRSALEMDPSFEQAQLNLATALHDAGKDADAVLELRKMVAREPSHARAHYLLGLIFSTREQTRPEAVEHYRKFLELQPNDPAAERITAWLEG